MLIKYTAKNDQVVAILMKTGVGDGKPRGRLILKALLDGKEAEVTKRVTNIALTH